MLLLFLIPIASNAGYITIIGSPNISVTGDSNQVSIKGGISLVNKGNEKSIDVYPMLRINGWKWAGKSTELDAGGGKKWIISGNNIPVPLIGYSDEFPSKEGFKLINRGYYPLNILRYYRDQNGYQFSSPGVQKIEIGDLTDDEQSERGIVTFQGRLNFNKGGQKFKSMLTIKNLSHEDQDVLLSFHTSQELEIMNRPEIVQIPAQQTKEVPIVVKNFSGLNGSTYDFFTVLQWNQKSIRNSLYVRSTVRIAEAASSNLLLFGAGAILVLGIIMFRVFLKRSNKK
jgi:hypothetical protein